MFVYYLEFIIVEELWENSLVEWELRFLLSRELIGLFGFIFLEKGEFLDGVFIRFRFLKLR